MKEKMRYLYGLFLRNLKNFLVYVILGILILSYILFFIIPLWLGRKPKGTYTQQEVISVNNEESFSSMEYHFYLDFSPSMEGFFWEEINSNIAILAEVLKNFNYLGSEQKLYWCADKIIRTNANDFYMSMTRTREINEYYESKWILNEEVEDMSHEEIPKQFIQVIEEIDLSNIFSQRYEDDMVYSEKKEDLNLIVTDFNFIKEGRENEGRELLKRFADAIGKASKGCNISIYQIYSKFAGEAIDSIEIHEKVPNTIEDSFFYIIILSENNDAYFEFTEYLEEKLIKYGIDVSHKFELLNNIGNNIKNLSIDIKSLLAMNLIEKKNLNFDNQSFEELPSNAIGMRLVRGHGPAILNMCVAPIVIPGYYNSDVIDYSKIETNIHIYYPVSEKQYEEIKNSEIIKFQKASLEWVQKQLYLRLQIELSSDVAFNKPVSYLQQIKNQIGINFFVLDIQFFMEEPSYSLPNWIEEEDELGIRNIFDNIISKRAISTELEALQKYLGSMVIYVIYEEDSI